MAEVREKNALLNRGENEEDRMRIQIGSAPAPLPDLTPRSPRYSSGGQVLRGFSDIPGREGSASTNNGGYTMGGSYATVTELSTGDELDLVSLADDESQKRSAMKQPTEKERSEIRDTMLTPTPTPKRKRGLFVDDDSDDDDFEDGLNSEDEKEMAALAETVSKSQSDPQGRNSLQQKIDGPFTTPSAQRTHNVFGGLATPNTRPTVSRNTLLTSTEEREREAKRQRMEPPPPPTPSHAPTGSARSEAATSLVGGEGGDDYGITEEVTALLGGVPMLDDDVKNAVRRTLNSYALRVKGVERGRDMARSALKMKDGRIAELQGRVAQLEAERSLNREKSRRMNQMLESMYEGGEG